MAESDENQRMVEVYERLLSLGYVGHIKSLDDFLCAFSEGEINKFFYDLATWLSSQLGTLLRLDNRISINLEESLRATSLQETLRDPVTFLNEMSLLLKEMQCPIQLTPEQIEEELKSAQNQLLVSEYLIHELLDGNIKASKLPKVEKEVDQEDLEGSRTANELRKFLMNLKFSKPHSDLKASEMFSELDERICTLSQPLLLEEALFTGVLTESQWYTLERLYGAFHTEYRNRRAVDVTQATATFMKFMWNGRIKRISEDLVNLFTASNQNVSVEPDEKLSDILTATADTSSGEMDRPGSTRKDTSDVAYNAAIIQRISEDIVNLFAVSNRNVSVEPDEKSADILTATADTSSGEMDRPGSTRKDTSDVTYNAAIIQVPEHGGHPDEQRPPPPELPSGQPRQDPHNRGRGPFTMAISRESPMTFAPGLDIQGGGDIRARLTPAHLPPAHPVEVVPPIPVDEVNLEQFENVPVVMGQPAFRGAPIIINPNVQVPAPNFQYQRGWVPQGYRGLYAGRTPFQGHGDHDNAHRGGYGGHIDRGAYRGQVERGAYVGRGGHVDHGTYVGHNNADRGAYGGNVERGAYVGRGGHFDYGAYDDHESYVDHGAFGGRGGYVDHGVYVGHNNADRGAYGGNVERGGHFDYGAYGDHGDYVDHGAFGGRGGHADRGQFGGRRQFGNRGNQGGQGRGGRPQVRGRQVRHTQYGRGHGNVDGFGDAGGYGDNEG